MCFSDPQTRPKRIAFLRAFTDSLPGPIEPDAGTGFAPMLYMSRNQLVDLAGMLPPAHAAIVNAVADMGEEERLYHLTTESEYNGHIGKDIFICYFGRDVHGQITLNLPEEATYIIEVIDTWNMTIRTIASGKRGECKDRIPEAQWMAVVARRED